MAAVAVGWPSKWVTGSYVLAGWLAAPGCSVCGTDGWDFQFILPGRSS